MTHLRLRLAAFILAKPIHFFGHLKWCFSADVPALLGVIEHETIHARITRCKWDTTNDLTINPHI